MTGNSNGDLFDRSNPAMAAFAQASDTLLADAVASGGVPGVVAAPTNADHTFYKGAAGLRALDQAASMDAQTVMWIASMTKPVVAACAMRLVEQGRIGLDDQAAKIIPELGQFRVLTGWESNGQPITRPPNTAITLRNPLTHSAGFVYDTWNAEMPRYHKRMGMAPRRSSSVCSLMAAQTPSLVQTMSCRNSCAVPRVVNPGKPPKKDISSFKSAPNKIARKPAWILVLPCARASLTGHYRYCMVAIHGHPVPRQARPTKCERARQSQRSPAGGRCLQRPSWPVWRSWISNRFMCLIC